MVKRAWVSAGLCTALLLAACQSKDGDMEPVHRSPSSAPDDPVTTQPKQKPNPTPPPPLVTTPAPASGWTFYGPEQGGPARVFGASYDSGGNLWVAGGEEGLFLLPSGAERYRRFTYADGLGKYADSHGERGYSVIAVAGGAAGTVYVGYEGLFGGQEDNDPAYMVKSGDAARVTLTQSGISVSHYDISTPPGVKAEYPTGRDKIRSVYRVLFNRANGDVWFGGNHGVALAKGGTKVVEHQHAAINGYTAAGTYTLLSGDWFGVALDAEGSLWMGGGHRLAKLQYGSSSNFDGRVSPILDVWPDANTTDPKASERTDDYIQDLALSPGGSVWVGSIPNGLARIGFPPQGSSEPVHVSYVRSGMVDAKVTALETDPSDGSLWVGHIYGGMTRIKDGTFIHYDHRLFGASVIAGTVPDIQSAQVGSSRRIVASFQTGVVGIYSGP